MFANSQRLALDNLIRRELKVGDPNDAAQVAQALMNRYRDDPRARAMAQEAQGLPFVPGAPAAAVAPQQAVATGLDLQQALADVESDLRELTTNNLSKDIVPELEGWAQALRGAIEQGVTVARQGIDTRSRDKAFAVRRQLGDYARLARLVGVLTPPMNASYRNLAQSLDEVASVILVMMGEALANTGMAGGRFLLQAPFSDLQLRREVVLNALRNLTGATQEAFGPSDWPRGIDAYRQLYRMFQTQGYDELRSLLMEDELARSMDELIQLAGGGAANGLRALGATAFTQLNRFMRFVQLTSEAVSPASPPLVAFQEALQVFIDGFAPAGGFRLLRIARPAILFYGLYGSDEVSRADRRLLQLVINRGTLAGQLDCLSRCECSDAVVRTQIVGDRALYDLDRAIDLYCIGDADLGIPEVRASAFGFVIEAAPALMTLSAGSELPGLLGNTAKLLRPPEAGQDPAWDAASVNYGGYPNGTRANPPSWKVALLRELQLQQRADEDMRSIVEQMTSNCVPMDAIFGRGCLGALADTALAEIDRVLDLGTDFELLEPAVPAALETSFSNALTHRRPRP
jgi:hypothetical protein